MKLPRRRVLQLGAGALALPVVPDIVRAATYPARPVTLVVPVAAGGGVDALARVLAERLRDKLEQPVTVENRPGAGSAVGAGSVAKSAPDGYTLLLMEPAVVVAKWLNKSVTFNVTTDFAPIALVATQPLVLFAHPSVPANDVHDLVEYCRAFPRRLSVGTAGVGSPHHLAAAWLNQAAKIEIVHQPYRGAGPALNDLLGGHVPLIWALPTPVMPFVEDGKVKALGVSTAQRFPMLPQVPTVAERTVPGFDLDFFYGVAAPAGVPPDVVARISDALREITVQPAFAARMSTMGLTGDFRGADAFREFITEKYAKYGAIVREAGIDGG